MQRVKRLEQAQVIWPYPGDIDARYPGARKLQHELAKILYRPIIAQLSTTTRRCHIADQAPC